MTVTAGSKNFDWFQAILVSGIYFVLENIHSNDYLRIGNCCIRIGHSAIGIIFGGTGMIIFYKNKNKINIYVYHIYGFGLDVIIQKQNIIV